MGLLNTNDIPPNPLVHGWIDPDLPPPPRSGRTVAREVPLAAGTPLPSQRSRTGSPLQRAHEIVSQPLPPARRPASSAWPMVFVFAAILIIASLIFSAAVPHGQNSHAQSTANTNQVAANSSFSGSQAAATPVSTPPVPVVTQNINATQTDSGRTDQTPNQTLVPNNPSSGLDTQTTVAEQEKTPQNYVPTPIAQSPPVLPAVTVIASSSQTDSRPIEVARFSPESIPQAPVLIQTQRPLKYVPALQVQRGNGSTGRPDANYSEINVATASRAQKPSFHVFRTIGNVVSWPVVHVVKTVGSVLPMQEPTRFINVYPQQQSFHPNPVRVYYPQPPAPPMYQQRVYYNSQPMPQVRYAPNYPSYRPPNMMGAPMQQRRMR